MKEDTERQRKIKTNNGFDIYKENYWDMTEEIEVKVEIGWKRKRRELDDEGMTRKIMNQYDLDGNNIKIICTDGSKTEKGRSAAIVEEEQEEGFYVSMDKRCSVHIAEMFAIAKAIQKNYNVNKDLIVYSDAKSAVEYLMDN